LSFFSYNFIGEFMKKILLLLILLLPLNINALDINTNKYILMDMDTNRVILGENINEVKSVASISKIMTAILAIESGKLEDKVTIGNEILKSYGSGIYIKQGEVLTLKDLVYGLMLRSGNDASYSIAKYVGGSVDNFVKMMNDKAIEIGMKNTTFNNPNGLDEEKGNYSTAYDMALLTSYAMKNKEYQKITKTTKYVLKTNMNTYSWTNKNKLLKLYKYTTGGKTGYTKIAKRTLVTTASKNNINLVVVTLNDGDDWNDHIELFEYGFNKYKRYQILKKGSIEVPDTHYKNYNYYIKNNFSYLLDNIEKDNIIIKFKIEKNKIVKNNMKIGNVEVYLTNTLIHKDDLYINKKEELSFWDKIKRWFKND